MQITIVHYFNSEMSFLFQKTLLFDISVGKNWTLEGHRKLCLFPDMRPDQNRLTEQKPQCGWTAFGLKVGFLAMSMFVVYTNKHLTKVST